MIKILAISILSLFSTPREEARIKALFIESFMRNMEWPAEKGTDKYNIAVIGDIYVVEQIMSLTNNRLINNRPVKVVNYTSDVKMEELNILFISKSLSDLYPDYHKTAIANSVLVVTEEKGLSKAGAGVNFVSQKDKLVFELNTATLEEAGIRASKAITETAEQIN
ncbi:MAG: YfiR family protein [Cyclobacteriaceae bacterium]